MANFVPPVDSNWNRISEKTPEEGQIVYSKKEGESGYNSGTVYSNGEFRTIEEKSNRIITTTWKNDIWLPLDYFNEFTGGRSLITIIKDVELVDNFFHAGNVVVFDIGENKLFVNQTFFAKLHIKFCDPSATFSDLLDYVHSSVDYNKVSTELAKRLVVSFHEMVNNNYETLTNGHLYPAKDNKPFVKVSRLMRVVSANDDAIHAPILIDCVCNEISIKKFAWGQILDSARQGSSDVDLVKIISSVGDLDFDKSVLVLYSIYPFILQPIQVGVNTTVVESILMEVVNVGKYPEVPFVTIDKEANTIKVADPLYSKIVSRVENGNYKNLDTDVMVLSNCSKQVATVIVDRIKNLLISDSVTNDTQVKTAKPSLEKAEVVKVSEFVEQPPIHVDFSNNVIEIRESTYEYISHLMTKGSFDYTLGNIIKNYICRYDVAVRIVESILETGTLIHTQEKEHQNDLNAYTLNHIQKILESGEPIFLLRGSDKNAVPVIKAYQQASSFDMPDKEKEKWFTTIGKQIYKFINWQEDNPGKVKSPNLLKSDPNFS